MTKSIEKQADEYPPFNTTKETFLSGAKAREEQLMGVVNELRSAVHCDYGCKTNQDHGWMVVKCNCGAEKSLTKADQMLKEMNIDKGEHYE